jgi:hypothetical protein
MCKGFMYGTVQVRLRELDHSTTLGIGGIGCGIVRTLLREIVSRFVWGPDTSSEIVGREA